MAAAVAGFALVTVKLFLRKRPLEVDFVTQEEFGSFRAALVELPRPFVVRVLVRRLKVGFRLEDRCVGLDSR